MRPAGSAASLEKRRRRAVGLARRGKGIRAVAREVRASPGAVHRWIQDWKKHGNAALAARPTPGRPRKLSGKQHEKLQKRLLAGAMACGFPNEPWTLQRIATLIRREFGVRYHPSHLWRVLRACGWSRQVPDRRATQRGETAVARWMRHKWPVMKKSAKAGRPHHLR